MTYSVHDLQSMATSIAASGLFKKITADQAMVLMLLAMAEGKPPAAGIRDYDIIDGKPAKKTESMVRDFIAAGGRITWHALTDNEATATFSHAQGGEVKIDWTMDRARKAKLATKDNWIKYSRAMLRTRCASEGIKAIFPMATGGLYTPEEIADFADNIRISAIQPPALDYDDLCAQLANLIANATVETFPGLYDSDFMRSLSHDRPDFHAALMGVFENRAKELGLS